MIEPHAVVLWSMAFERALSLVCTPQRTREGALSWSMPSDEQLKYVRAWADFVAEKASPCESRSDEIQREIASTWGDES